MDSPKYILLQNNYTVSYTDTDCFENGIRCKNYDGSSSSEEFAQNLKQRIYSVFLKRHYKNIIVLTAAGTSIDNGGKNGKTRNELWKYCINEIKAIYKRLLPCNSKLKDIAKKKDIEALLSYIIMYEKIQERPLVDENSIYLKKELEKKIAEACRLELDTCAPHEDFLNKVTARKPSDSRIQLFTTNYDTLFEQAANKPDSCLSMVFHLRSPGNFQVDFLIMIL